MNNRAILMIDGKRSVLKKGDTVNGVTLIDATSRSGLIEVNGMEQAIEPGMVTVPVGTSSETGSENTLVLWANSQGFFFADGSINGRSVRFLVDTGANTIAMSSATARQIGLDYSAGVPGMARTAGGDVRMTNLTLREVSIGGIKLNNIHAGVVEGIHPPDPLLGQSFLKSLEMTRSGDRMELKRKF